MQSKIDQEWACAASHAAALAGGFAAVRTPSAAALRSCRAELEKVLAHLDAIDAVESSLRCDPKRCDTTTTVRCELCSSWFCSHCCDQSTHVCDDCCVQLEDTEDEESDSASKERGADEAAEGGAAAKKRKLEGDEAASEDDEVIPDLDDPHVPAWVWDWLLKDGKITAKDRLRAAQHADDEAGGNLCVKCGVDMGADNPRQYCGKNVCLGLGFE